MSDSLVLEQDLTPPDLTFSMSIASDHTMIMANNTTTNDTANPFKVLSLLDAYTSYHTDGIIANRKAVWNLTKARYRTNGGIGSALLPMTSSTSSSSNPNHNDKPKSVYNNKTKDFDNNSNSNSGSSNSMEMSGTVILSFMNPNNTLRTRSAVDISVSGKYGCPIYKLIDPVVVSKEKQQQEEQDQSKQVEEEEENDNTVVADLVPEKDDNNDNEPFQIVHDPTQSTGLRQRGTTTTQRHTNTKSSSIMMMEETVTGQQKNEVYDDTKKLSYDDTTTSEIETIGTVVDPFDDEIISIMNFYGCNGSYKKQMKEAQQNAIVSLQHYIHAATIVAAIQHELLLSNDTK